MEGLVFGGAYIQREICVTKFKKSTLLYRFCPFDLFCIWVQFPSISPQGLIFGGAI